MSCTRSIWCSRRLVTPAMAVVSLGIAAAAEALTPATLVRPNLEGEAVTVTGLRGDQLVYFDDQRRLRHESIDQFVQLRDIGETEAAAMDAAAVGSIELTDGQRFVGQMMGTEPAADMILWRTPSLGDVRVSLEQLSRLRISESEVDSGEPSGTPAVDGVLLRNGDRLSGFIERIGDRALDITPDQGETLTLPLQRVAWVELANPASWPQQVQAAASGLVLHDGSRLRVLDLELSAERLTFRLPLSTEPDARQTLPLEQVAQIDFTGSGWHLVDLASQPMSVRSGGEVFGLSMGPYIDRGAIHLHAPVAIRFELPAQTRRFAADAELAIDADLPAEASAWADFEVIVNRHDAGGHRFRISSDEPAMRMNLPIQGDALDIELDAGVNGPLLDRLRLVRGVLLRRVPVRDVTESAE